VRVQGQEMQLLGVKPMVAPPLPWQIIDLRALFHSEKYCKEY
jgi:hypothetical protein